jgi:uncharacterized membrane protein
MGIDGADELDEAEDGHEVDELLGESRWPPAITLVVAMVVPLLLPERYSLGPPWAASVVLLLLLVALTIADPGRINKRSSTVRALEIGLVAVLAIGAAGVTIALTVELINGDQRLNDATTLLESGGLVLLDIIIAFTFVYWEADGGGTVNRARRITQYPDFAFPEHMNPDLAPPGWRPLFLDYLYLAITDAIAFSPTDVMPLKHWAKMAMALESIMSLVIVGLVIARAVNILN